jgi:hypothetical protein
MRKFLQQVALVIGGVVAMVVGFSQQPAIAAQNHLVGKIESVTEKTPLVLTQVAASDSNPLIQHYSHSSHQSHQSHVSHYSSRY